MTFAEFHLLVGANLSAWDTMAKGFNIPMAIFLSPTGPRPVCSWQATPEGTTSIFTAPMGPDSALEVVFCSGIPSHGVI
jgi:hypothetical protein